MTHEGAYFILLYLTVLYEPDVGQQEIYQGRPAVRAHSSRIWTDSACAVLHTSPNLRRPRFLPWQIWGIADHGFLL